MNNHQNRKAIGFIFPILALGLMVLIPISVQSNPIYYGMLGRGDTTHVVKAEPDNFYHDGILSIPGIVTLDHSVLYHSIQLHYDPAIDAYKLVRVNAIPLNEDIVAQVDLIVTGEQPIQAILKLSGYFNYSCGNVLIVNQGHTHLRFEVTVAFYNQFSGTDTEPPCTTDDKLYTIVLPLQVYGLSTGTYEYVVNGTHTGTFELKSENVIK